MFSGSNEETDFAISSISFFCLVARGGRPLHWHRISGQFHAHGICNLLFSSTRLCSQSIYQSLHPVHLPELALSSSNVPTHPRLSREILEKINHATSKQIP